MKSFVTIHFDGGGDPCFYTLDDGGQVVETTFTHDDGTPDWDNGCLLDIGRFDDVEEMSRATLALLESIKRYEG